MSRTAGLSGYVLGRYPYARALALQERLHAERLAGTIADTVLLVEHPPVITFGRGASAEHVLASPEECARRGIDLVRTGRGGDVTLHLPGQLVVYPIVDLAPGRKDVRRYVRDLTEVMRRVAAPYGVDSGRIDQHVGLWVNRGSPGHFRGTEGAQDLAKLGAIGVRISRWVTMHGFALNLAPELELYSLIVPCGIREYGVTSIAELCGARPSFEQAAAQAFAALASVLGAAPEEARLFAGEPDAPAVPTINTLANGVLSDAP
jgi:lipoyl(octanoyl) transferase